MSLFVQIAKFSLKFISKSNLKNYYKEKSTTELNNIYPNAKTASKQCSPLLTADVQPHFSVEDASLKRLTQKTTQLPVFQTVFLTLNLLASQDDQDDSHEMRGNHHEEVCFSNAKIKFKIILNITLNFKL